MAQREKQVLIVDDSEIDREILKNILEEDFEIMEADNGFAAIEVITAQSNEIDAILLDVSMPLISGFDVLRLLNDNKMNNIPVFMISAEATKDNVLRGAEFGVAEFICKPFDAEDIIRRLRSRLGIVTNYWLTIEDISQINQYMDKLQALFKVYCANFGRDDKHYVNMVELMRILLTRYAQRNRDAELNRDKIEIISRAAYFCDIGYMLVPDKMAVFSKDPEKIKAITQNHTRYGGEIVKLDSSKHCGFFIEICAEMCLNHHERYDGHGYPRGISGKNLSVYSQMCRLVDEFDDVFSKLYGTNELQVNLVMKRFLREEGSVSPELLSLLEDCKPSIVGYYAKRQEGK